MMLFNKKSANSLLMCIIAVLSIGTISVADGVSGDFYVASDGSDTNIGSIDAPFATLARARNAVRERITAGLTSNILVLIRGGTYQLTEILGFGTQDSGTEMFSITYAAYPGEKVVLSGGRKITGWTQGAGQIWTTVVPGVSGGTWYPRQLFVNGNRVIRARTPNADDETPWWIIKTAVFTDLHNGTTPYYTLSVNHPIQAWSNPGDIEINYMWNDDGSKKFVGSVDATNQTFTFLVPGNYNEWTSGCMVHPPLNTSCFLENAIEMLDQPGEWYLNRTTGVLSYWPRSGEDMTNAEVIAPVVKNTLLVVIGTSTNPVINLHFKGIHIQHVDRYLPPQGRMELFCATQFTQTGYGPEHGPLEAAVEFKYARYCDFTEGGVSHVGGVGLCMRKGTAQNTIEGNEFGDIGASGIAFSEVRQPPWDTWSWNPAPGPNDYKGFRIANNYIHDCGLDYIGGVGIHAGVMQESVIAHNLIHDISYSGIQWAGDYDGSLGFSKNNTVEYNHIYNAMKGAVDGAALYVCFAHSSQTVVRGNLMHDTKWNPFGRGEIMDGIHDTIPCHGLYLDSNARGVRFENNVVYRNAGGPLLFNTQKSSNTWYDNFFQKEGTPPDEFLATIQEYAGLDPAYRALLLNSEPNICERLPLNTVTDTAPWVAYQFNLTQAGRGVIELVQRVQSLQDSVYFKLSGLDSSGLYGLKAYSGTLAQADQYFYDGTFFGTSDPDLKVRYLAALGDLPILSNVVPISLEGETLMTGQELMSTGLLVNVGGSPRAIWICYKRVDNCAQLMSNGYSLAKDLNHDCYFNIADFAFFAAQWLQDNNPTEGDTTEILIGNPNAENGWSTTSAVSAKASHSQWSRNAVHMIDGTGLDATGTIHNADDNYPREIWNADYDGYGGDNTEQNANPEGPVFSTCWVLFEFDQVYSLNIMHVWNFQVASYTCGGINNCTIQYSLTGGSAPSEWLYANAGPCYVGNPTTDPGHFQFPQAPGVPYAGFDAVNFGGARAKYVYIAVHDIAPAAPAGGDWDAPYGDIGLDEVRFSGFAQPRCGDPGFEYMAADFDMNCVIDFDDLAQLTSQWLFCYDPADANCTAMW
jgi:hypothetical protein